MSEQSNSTASQLVTELTSETADLVRAEVRRGQQELLGKAKEASKGAALVGGAAILGALGAGTSAVVVVRVLGRILPGPGAAVLATLLYAGGAAALGAAGVTELKRIGPLLPETIASVREDLRAAKPSTGS
ncbi:MAG: phage holin family protein [Janthinobacterium lividum]